MNSLMEFKEFAIAKNWEILATEHFPVPAGGAKVNATTELLNLREKGARVVLLSCLADYVPQVLEQAEKLDMIKEWVWILTDGAISKVSCLNKVIQLRFAGIHVGLIFAVQFLFIF